MRVSHAFCGCAVALPLLLLGGPAAAHFTLNDPPAADTDLGGGKGPPPCGPASDSGVVTPFQGGHEITLTVNETTSHDGFYRVALSIKSRTELPLDNVVYDKSNKVLPPGDTTGVSDHADFESSPTFPVLADNMFPHAGAPPKMYSGKVMLPNINCDKCTLQVIEFMAGHGYNTGGGYFYHHCADLKITADPAMPVFDPTAIGGVGGGGGSVGVAIMGTGGMSGTATMTAGAGGSTTTAGAGDNEADRSTRPSNDSGGCSMAGRRRGGASVIAALGMVFAAVVCRRRARS